MSRLQRGGPRPSARRVGVVLAVAGGVLGLAVLAQRRSVERQAAEMSSPDGPRPLALAPGELPDPMLERLLGAAEGPGASLVALDAAAHALLVRERFEEADALVVRTLSAFPKDAEAVIHRAVLRGVAGDTHAARAELDTLAAGPAGWEASLFSAGFALRDGDEAAALRALRHFLAAAPAAEVTPALRAEEARLEASASSSASKKLH